MLFIGNIPYLFIPSKDQLKLDLCQFDSNVLYIRVYNFVKICVGILFQTSPCKYLFRCNFLHNAPSSHGILYNRLESDLEDMLILEGLCMNETWTLHHRLAWQVACDICSALAFPCIFSYSTPVLCCTKYVVRIILRPPRHFISVTISLSR